ncbi:hypothetical protein IWQ60_001091 [Tieghemiomyces parasiticus]|uniref:TEA domain-containing protein n=1 Tax=Tieghemiomyces parasiticus TaxID=78921 RepID=A0A9W8ALP5_9FUNG|nr:hypothetical protein IWQ60_001091 [Tieghemiomyces parasiticus]
MLSHIRTFLCEDAANSYEVAAKTPCLDEMEEKWPEDVEDAFLEAVEYLKSVGRRKFSINGKLCGRNELISRYVFKKTRKYRSRKQVSSHIQVWKNSKKPPCRTGKGDPMDKSKFSYFQTLLQENHSATADGRSLPSSPCQPQATPSMEASLCSSYNTDALSNPASFDRLPLSLLGNEWALLHHQQQQQQQIQPMSPVQGLSVLYPTTLATPAPSVTEGSSVPSSPSALLPPSQDKVVIWPNYFGLYLEAFSYATMTSEQRHVAKMREVHATLYPPIPVSALSYHTQCSLSPLFRKDMPPVAYMKIKLDMAAIESGTVTDACITESLDGRPLQCTSLVISFGRQVFAKAEAKASVFLNNQHVYHFDFVSSFIGAYLNNVKLLGDPQAIENSLRNLTVCQTYCNLISDVPLLVVLYEFDLGDGVVEPHWVSPSSLDPMLSISQQLADAEISSGSV